MFNFPFSFLISFAPSCLEFFNLISAALSTPSILQRLSVVVRMAYRRSKRIGGMVGARDFFKAKDQLNHIFNLIFFCGSCACNSLFYNIRLVFKDFNSGLAIVRQITPRASATGRAVFVFREKKRLSMAPERGLHSSIIALSSLYILKRRSVFFSPASVLMQPCARYMQREPFFSITPQPVSARPGSTPRIRLVIYSMYAG